MRMETPADRKYSRGHVWVKVDGNIAVVGITDFAQKAMKDIVFAELPEKGQKVEKGQALCQLESVKSVNELKAPVSGEVVEVNSAIEKNPEKLNQAPYESWIAKIKLADAKEMEELLEAKEYGAIADGEKP